MPRRAHAQGRQKDGARPGGVKACRCGCATNAAASRCRVNHYRSPDPNAADMPPRGAGMQHAHCATGAGCSGQRKMQWPAHLRGRHDQVCARRTGGYDSQYATVLRELLRAGGGVARRYSRALPLTVCAFERRRKRVLRGRSGAKNGRTPVYLRISSCSTTVRSNLISWLSASLDFTPGY